MHRSPAVRTRALGEKSHGHWKLEDLETLGWSPGGTHSRLSRSEAVLDSVVVDIPVEAWVDVFDAPLMREKNCPFAAVMRARAMAAACTSMCGREKPRTHAW